MDCGTEYGFFTALFRKSCPDLKLTAVVCDDQLMIKNNLQAHQGETHLTPLGWQGLAKWKSAVSWDSSQSERTGREKQETTFLGRFWQRYTKSFAFFLLTLKGELGADRDIHADISISQINTAHVFPQECAPQYWTNFYPSFDKTQEMLFLLNTSSWLDLMPLITQQRERTPYLQ